MPDTAYQRLLNRVRGNHLLGATRAVLDWDQQTMLPPGGVEFRARQLKQLAELSHQRGTAPELAELLSLCEDQAALLVDPTSDSATNLREIRRSYDRATRLPRELVAELAETQSLAQNTWAEARNRDDFESFRPWLEKMVKLMRDKAQCLAEPGQEEWDALADDFEPGVQASDLHRLFRDLQAELTPLLGDITNNGSPPARRFHQHPAPTDAQERWVRAVAESMGFDFSRGRLDRSTHPFCSGTHRGDVRLTTRFHDAFVVDALGSTMHEAGHGIYEQGLPAAHVGTPLGQATSLGIHESQSRLWENHVGRSEAFWTFCRPLLLKHLGAEFEVYSAAEMYSTANLVTPDFIRVEADEATYNLHVIVRFELELAMIRGELEVADLPGAWREAYRRYLGVEVPDDTRGCLQDVHWSCGLFGYFPTYTLGNIYAAQFFESAQAALPDLDDQVASGNFAALKHWLNAHIHESGSRFRAADLCERVTGRPADIAPLMRHLEGKLRPIYQL
ncbi:MAG: carboxypeptidase M32 [Planctomycetota bacterium]|nr:carboxypeptidase M32 [Planctomycetota bacterium]